MADLSRGSTDNNSNSSNSQVSVYRYVCTENYKFDELKEIQLHREVILEYTHCKKYLNVTNIQCCERTLYKQP